jgi:hypothetical protein
MPKSQSKLLQNADDEIVQWLLLNDLASKMLRICEPVIFAL